MTWRLATPVDDVAVVRMSLALYEEDPSTVVVTALDIARTLATFRREPTRGRAVVCEERGELVGYALLVSFWSNELGGEVCTVDELYIVPDARSRGLGANLFDAIDAIDAIDDRDASSPKDGPLWPGKPAALALEVTPNNARARALYARVGFVAKNLTMYRKR